MDKNTFLAIVLSGAIMVIWYTVFPPPEPPPREYSDSIEQEDKEYIKLMSHKSYGSQELGMRMGTQAVPLIHGMSIALDEIGEETKFDNDGTYLTDTRITVLTEKLKEKLSRHWDQTIMVIILEQKLKERVLDLEKKY